MIKIRKNVFETNSSSTHSICITKNNKDIFLPENVVFKLDSFGWEEDVYYDTDSKASYLYSAIKYFEKYFDKEQAQGWLDFVCETLLKNNVKYDFDDSEEYFGIDHGGELSEFLSAVCHSEKRLLRFLFSAESFIITGNDNSDSEVDVNVTYPCEEFYKGN